MKKLIALMMVLAMLLPINVRAQDRTWWPDQICEEDEDYSFKQTGEWPGDVVSNEVAKDVIVFRPKVLAVQKFANSVKVKIDATTASRNIVVRYTVDGKNWIQRSYRNAGYKDRVICTRKWQCVLHRNDTSSSYHARQFSQGKESIDFKKTYRPKDYSAQLYFDDYLIDHTVRPKVVCPVVLNIPARATRVQIRYVYTGFKKTLYSDWLTVKVR